MTWWGLVAVLVLWVGLTAVRRRWEAVREPWQPPARPARRGTDEEIDHDALEQAEREVRDLDTDAKGRPLDNSLGDDWGPGTPKPPYT